MEIEIQANISQLNIVRAMMEIVEVERGNANDQLGNPADKSITVGPKQDDEGGNSVMKSIDKLDVVNRIGEPIPLRMRLPTEENDQIKNVS